MQIQCSEQQQHLEESTGIQEGWLSYAHILQNKRTGCESAGEIKHLNISRQGKLAQEISVDLPLWGSVKLPTAMEMLCVLLLC